MRVSLPKPLSRIGGLVRSGVERYAPELARGRGHGATQFQLDVRPQLRPGEFARHATVHAPLEGQGSPAWQRSLARRWLHQHVQTQAAAQLHSGMLVDAGVVRATLQFRSIDGHVQLVAPEARATDEGWINFELGLRVHAGDIVSYPLSLDMRARVEALPAAQATDVRTFDRIVDWLGGRSWIPELSRPTMDFLIDEERFAHNTAFVRHALQQIAERSGYAERVSASVLDDLGLYAPIIQARVWLDELGYIHGMQGVPVGNQRRNSFDTILVGTPRGQDAQTVWYYEAQGPQVPLLMTPSVDRSRSQVWQEHYLDVMRSMARVRESDRRALLREQPDVLYWSLPMQRQVYEHLDELISEMRYTPDRVEHRTLVRDAKGLYDLRAPKAEQVGDHRLMTLTITNRSTQSREFPDLEIRQQIGRAPAGLEEALIRFEQSYHAARTDYLARETQPRQRKRDRVRALARRALKRSQASPR